MQKGQCLQLNIEKMTSEGAGLARHEGMVVFVEGAISGDTVKAQVVEVKKNYANAVLTEIITPSLQRIKPDCRHFDICGGCSLQMLEYRAQLVFKAQSVAEALHKIGGIEIAAPTVHSFEGWQYRNRVQWHYAAGSLGFYDKQSHSRADIDSCLLTPAVFNEVLSWLRQSRLPSGLKHFTLQSDETNSRLLGIFCAELEDTAYAEAAQALMRQIPQMHSLWLNVGASESRLYGNSFRHLAGERELPVTLCGIKLSLYPSAFLQVNYAGCEALYRLVLQWAELKGRERVYDIYCGIGALSLLLARNALEVCGIEYSEQAVKAARLNAERNAAANLRFICERAEYALPRLITAGGSADLIVLDPPRSGCDAKVMQAVLEAAPDKLIYISCNPATLARDVRLLTAHYSLDKLQCFDLFPQTPHVETAALLIKR